MGSKCSVFVNKTNVEMELRVFLPPSRPGRYRRIIRIKPGEWKLLSLTRLGCEDSSVVHSIHMMLIVDGVYTGTTFYPYHIKRYANILGYLDGNVRLSLRGRRIRAPIFCGVIRQNREDAFV